MVVVAVAGQMKAPNNNNNQKNVSFGTVKTRERKRELKRLISESENESGKKILCLTL